LNLYLNYRHTVYVYRGGDDHTVLPQHHNESCIYLCTFFNEVHLCVHVQVVVFWVVTHI